MATDAALAEGPSKPGSLSRWLFLQQQRFAWFLLIPALTILIPLFLFPLAILLRNSFNWDEPGAIMVEDFIVANYVRILTDSYYASLFGNSILVAGGVALLTLIIGYPFAYYLVRWAGERRNLLLWIIYTPLIVSVITRVFGWMVITADSGLINTLLMSMGVTEGPVHILFEVSGMVIGMVHRYLPLMILPLANSIAKIDTRILLASTSLGAGASATFARVIIPLSLPGIVAGLQLVIAVVLSDFVPADTARYTTFPDAGASHLRGSDRQRPLGQFSGHGHPHGRRGCSDPPLNEPDFTPCCAVGEEFLTRKQ